MTALPAIDNLRLGSIFVIRDDDASPLPLESTRVTGSIIGALAEVQVTQGFGNPFDTPIELEYLFPLPEGAAVVDYTITIGARTIVADVQERAAAQRAYDDAVQRGQRASLLEQRRPNLFAIRLGNVQPRERIITTLTYEDRLSYADGALQFIFPMGITPRYHSTAESPASAASADAPIALPSERIAPVELDLTIDAGVPMTDPTSSTHAITITRESGSKLSLTLAGANIPDKDFVLRYAIDAADVQAAVWSVHDGDEETALISLFPPRINLQRTPQPREFIFVLDRSGSMSTEPMTKARNAIKACLRALDEGDVFYIQAFDDKIEWLDTQPAPVEQAAIERADAWLEGISSRGGTEILGAISAALALPPRVGSTRYVVFLTDGAVSADDAAIRKIAQARKTARIFTFGIGASVNRHLLNKMAQIGRGAAQFIGLQDDIEAGITQFQDRLAYPALLDIVLEWSDAQAWDTYPTVLPDLYAGQPLEIATRLTRSGNAIVRVSGTQAGTTRQFSVPIPLAWGNQLAVKRLWARARIESLIDALAMGGDEEQTRQQIIALGLRYRLVTAHTSFVAIDSEVTTGGEAKTIRVAVPLPDGVDYEAYLGIPARGAASYGGGAMRMMMAAPMAGMMAAPSMDDDEDTTFSALLRSMPKNAPMRVMKRAVSELQTTLPAVPEVDATTPSDLIKQLARTQRVNGSWDDDLELTAAALLLFIRSGHTTRSGDYRAQLGKAVRWLQAQFAHTSSGFPICAAYRALRDLEDATGDTYTSDDLRANPPPATTPLEQAALNATSAPLPNPLTTLDDLRLAALTNAKPQAVALDDTSMLARVWLAALTPQA